MKNFAIYFFLLILTPALLFGQSKDPAFAFVRAGGGPSPSYGHEAGDQYPEYPVVRQVFQDLIEAQGNRQLPRPRLLMYDATQYVAWMDPEGPVIGLETKAYEVCRSFGADSLNAVAALLAHELTHYYQEHGWSRQFAAETDGDLGEKIAEGENSLNYETQADHLGGFLTYAAGYPTFGMMPELLERLYDAYALDAQLDGYPSLEERKALAADAGEQVKQLVDIYEMSVLLTALERFDDARLYLNRILRDFQSRDLYNNLGVMTVLEALAQFHKNELPFGLPIELDAEGRLKQGATRFPCQSQDCRQARIGLLERAIESFDQAIALDPDYATAFLNKAIAYHLLNLPEDAEYFASRALRMAKKQNTPKSTADAWTMLGILAAAQADEQKALENFEKAKALGSGLAAENIRILKNEAKAVLAVSRSAKGMEMIDSLRPETFLSNPVIDREATVNDAVILGIADNEKSTVYFHFADNGRSYAFFHVAKENYAGRTTLGIRTGDAEQEVVKRYQKPYRRLELRTGAVLVYPVHQLLLFLDESGKVQKWAVFREKKAADKY